MNNKSMDTGDLQGLDDFDDLNSIFGVPEDEYAQMEKISLTENLEGFASCFPSWDLHPPR